MLIFSVGRPIQISMNSIWNFLDEYSMNYDENGNNYSRCVVIIDCLTGNIEMRSLMNSKIISSKVSTKEESSILHT
jgi:hypothetical protein